MMAPLDTAAVLDAAEIHLEAIAGHTFDLLTVSPPVSPAAALNLAKVVSKLSPLLGNLIEFNLVELLNAQPVFSGVGYWERQDPGFPDAVFRSSISPLPGIEIKAWFPLATEITARFRDSQNHFRHDNIRVAMLAWLPDQLIYGKPRILDVCVASAASVAAARDNHYHRPPDYLVIEPEDTTTRTRNLQQTNTAGYKWQGSTSEFGEAQAVVASWGPQGGTYDPSAPYQAKLRDLTRRYSYRLDTNFAKIDRIAHPEVEIFKTRVFNTLVRGMTVRQWARLLASENDAAIAAALETHLNIRATAVAALLE